MSFNRDNRGGGRRFDRRPAEMHQVICSNCGKETEVPFKPTGDRPVYCRECYAKTGGGERRSFGSDRRDNRDSRPPFRKFEGRNRQGPSNSTQLSEISAKLDQLIKLLTPKVEEKPVIEVPAEKKVVKKKKAVKKAPAETPVETPEEV